MKLHLPKQLFTALLAVLTLAAPAALTLSSTAWGEETTGETAESTILYSGTVYSYTGVNSGKELAYSILSYETDSGTVTISGKSGSWTDIQNAIGKDGSNKTFNTLRFYSTSPAVKALTYTFNPIAVAGFIVESGASGYSITSSGTSDRLIYIGNTSETKAYTTIEENFSLNNTSDTDSSINLRGEQEWQIANGKTFTLTSGSSGIINQAEGNLTISGQGTAVMGSAFTNNGTVTVNSGATLSSNGTFTNNATLSLGAASHSIGTLAGSGALNVTGNNEALTYASTDNNTYTLSITNALAGYSGAISLDKATMYAGGTADYTVTSLTLKDHSEFYINTTSNANTFKFNSVKVSGETVLGAKANASYWQAQINIANLTSEGEATLTLFSNYRNSGTNVFNLEGGDFDGTIVFKGTSNSSRKFALNIKGSTMLQDAVVQFDGTTANNSAMGLGIANTSVTVKGITGTYANAAIYSGEQDFGINKNLGTKTDGYRTLVIDTDGNSLSAGGEYSTNAAVGNYLNLQKTGTGTQSFTGNMSAFNGSIQVEGGTLTLGTEGQNGTMGLSNTITVSSGATLKLYNSFTNVNLTDLDTTSAGTSWSDSVNGNGYAGATYILVENSGSTTVGSGITVNGHALNERVSDGEDVTFTVTATGGDYYVNNNVDNAALVYDIGTAISSDATTGIILNGGNLNMQTSLNTAATNGIIANQSATINLASNAVTLEKSKLSINGAVSVTLSGSGTFDLGALGNGVKHSSMTADNDATRLSSDGWTGTVSFSGGTKATGNNSKSVQDINFNLLGRAGSTVEIATGGVYGYLLQGNTTFTPDIKLSGNMVLQNGYSNNTYTFKGDFSGSGNFETNKYLGGNGLDFIFTGDMSAWTGSLVQSMKDDAYSYKFAAADGKNTTIANGFISKEVTGQEVVMDVIISNDNNVEMAGTLTAETGSTLKVTHEGTGNMNIKSVEVQGSGKVLVEGLSITATDSETNATMTAKANTTGALKYLAQETSFTIEDMTLTNTTVTAATAETRVNLQNVEGSTALLAKGAFTLHATPTVGMSPNGDTPGTLSYSNGLAIAMDKNASLTLNLDVVNAVAGDAHGTYDLTITLSGFGEGFAVTEDILGMVGFDSTSWLGQALVSQKAEYTVVTEQTPATAGEGGVPTVSYAAGTGASVGSLVITISGLNVPEPTTSTLSLLALAALAARRRRK